MKNLVPLLLASALAGCQAFPAASGTSPLLVAGATAKRTPAKVRSAVPPALAKIYAPLAHEGGIVWLSPLESIASEAKQAAAALLGAELAAEQRATRAMSDAALIVGRDAGLSPYQLAQIGEPPAPPPIGFSGTPWFMPHDGHRPDGPPRDRFHAFEREAAGEVRVAWQGLTPDQRVAAEGRHGERYDRIRAELRPRLDRRQGQFARLGPDETAAAADGAKTVTTTFRFAGPDGDRTVRVQRAYDPQGSLVQIVETLTGSSDGVDLDCERVRTFEPDGAVEHASDLQIVIGGRVHNVHWAKRTLADGTLAGKGSIVRPEGGEVALTAESTAETRETITGQDPSGVVVKLEADAASGTAQATIDAGADGAAAIRIGVDVETITGTSALP